MMEIKGDIFINKDGEGFFGEGRYKLLKLIDKYGSCLLYTSDAADE